MTLVASTFIVVDDRYRALGEAGAIGFALSERL